MNKRVLFFCKSLLLGILLLTAGESWGQGMALEWARSAGGKTEDACNAVTTDKYGNVYLAGYFRDTMDFDPGTGVYNLVARGNSDIYVMKLDASGNFKWAKQMGGKATAFFSLEFGYSVAVDTTGNVFVSGVFSDTADFDPGVGVYNMVCNGGQSDAFVAKLDSTGGFMWAKSWGYTSSDDARKVITDDSGNVYLTGRFGNIVDFDPGPGTYNMTGNDVYALKLDANGNFVWASQAYASGIASGIDLVRDALGCVYVCGDHSIDAPVGASWWGAGTSVFAWKMDPSGNTVWHYQFDDDPPPSDHVSAIALDPAGYIYLAGYFSDSIDCDPGPGQVALGATGMDMRDIYVVKLDTAANVIWVKGIGNMDTEEARGMKLDQSGNIYVTGTFQGTVDFDPGPGVANLTSVGPVTTGDAYILKLDSAGNYKWAYGMGTDGHEWGHDVSVDQHGAVYTAGVFGLFIGPAAADFDPGPGIVNLNSKGYGDAFIQKLVCNDTSTTTLTDTACISYTLNGQVYTASGTYTQVRPNTAGCDSMIILQLTIPQLDPVITVNGFVLGTALPYTTYQWYRNGVLIAGATNTTYTVSQNGDYTVVVTNNKGCSDTSAIYTVTNATTIEDIAGLASQIHIYPNPSADLIYIESPVPVDLALSSIEGKVIRTYSKARSVSVKDLAAGVYLLQIKDKQGLLIKTEKIIKQVP